MEIKYSLWNPRDPKPPDTYKINYGRLKELCDVLQVSDGKDEKVMEKALDVVRPSISRIAQRISTRHGEGPITIQDLRQEGEIFSAGFLGSPGAGVWRRRYGPMLIGHLNDIDNSNGWSLVLPARAAEQMGKFKAAIEERGFSVYDHLSQEVRKSICTQLGLRWSRIKKLKQLFPVCEPISLGVCDSVDPSYRIDPFEGRPVEEAFDESEIIEKVKLAKKTANLTPRQQLLIDLRFGFDGGIPLTLLNVGNRLGITQERVRQVEQDAFSKIRFALRGL